MYLLCHSGNISVLVEFAKDGLIPTGPSCLFGNPLKVGGRDKERIPLMTQNVGDLSVDLCGFDELFSWQVGTFFSRCIDCSHNCVGVFEVAARRAGTHKFVLHKQLGKTVWKAALK